MANLVNNNKYLPPVKQSNEAYILILDIFNNSFSSGKY